MIITFPTEDGTEACIAWGKVRGTFGNESMSPVTMAPFGNGTYKFGFRMNLSGKKVGGKYEFEEAGVTVWARQYDQMGNKLADVVKLLRKQDPVVVFGKHRIYEFTDRTGVKRVGHDITADAVIPAAWMYDLMLALFSKVVSEPPRLKPVNKPGPKPKTQKQPTVTHPVVVDEEGWFQ